MTTFPTWRQAVWLQTTIIAVLVLFSTTASAQFRYRVTGLHQVNGETVLSQSEDSPAGIDLPTVDLTTDIQTFFDTRPTPRAGQLWSYGDATGRVRVALDETINGQQTFEDRLVSGIRIFPSYLTALGWKRQFIKTTQTGRRTSTILPSKVELYTPLTFADDPLATVPEFQPFADMYFTIQVCDLGQTIFESRTQVDLVGETFCRTAFGQSAELRGYSNFYSGEDNPRFRLESEGGENGPIFEGFSTTGPGSFPGPVPLRIRIGSPLSSTVQMLYGRYVHELDLSWIPDGHAYQIEYDLLARGGSYTDQAAKVYLADPLSPDSAGSGISTVNPDPPAMASDLPPSLRTCDKAFDDGQYVISGELATDRYTGLTWQRCGLGTTLDDGGTPADITDDRCTQTGTTTNNWQQALQAAEADGTSGFADWRVPNVKELATLTASCADVQIEPWVFPDTAASVSHWSSTPDARTRGAGPSVWTVNFGNGGIDSSARTAALAARLVRDSGQAPVAPLPSIAITSAAAIEGDSGSTNMPFTVSLSEAAASSISVDYTVMSPNANAEANVDYTPVSGTVTFAPGETAQTINVPVLGDTTVELNEVIYVSLTNNTAGTRVASLRGIGTILDDEPVVEFVPRLTQVAEGAPSEQRSVAVPVRLSRPAPAPVSVDFELADGSAIVGTDVAAATGTLTFDTGEDLATVTLTTIGDDVAENDESVQLILTNALGAKLRPGVEGRMTQDVIVTDDDGRRTYAALNDTGIIECATDERAFLDCPQTGYPNQDGDTGRDADPANAGGGLAGFSFVKVDATGTALSNQFGSYFSTPWSCVEDTVTGLTWEVKTPNRSTFEDNNLYSARWTYTWYNSSGVNDGGGAGTENGGSCIDSTNCDIEKYVAAVNASALCGFTDWRVPSVDEFYTIVNMRLNDWRLDTSYFPNLSLGTGTRGTVWTATPIPDSPNRAFFFNRVGASDITTTFTYPVRLVRGGSQ